MSDVEAVAAHNYAELVAVQAKSRRFGQKDSPEAGKIRAPALSADSPDQAPAIMVEPE